jgi:hypothetical protein
MRIRLLACLLLLLALAPLPCRAFELMTTSDPGAYLKWNLANGPVSVVLSSRGSDDLPFSVVRTNVVDALQTWSEVSNQEMRLVYGGDSYRTAINSADMQNSILWIETDWQYSESTVALTRTSYYLDDPTTIIDADIVLNGCDFTWGSSLQEQAGIVDVRKILTHELGHVIGLAHSSVGNAMMFPSPPMRQRYSLSADDRSGERFLYGRPVLNFAPITPVQNAGYVKGMAERRLPLPIFRWGPFLSRAGAILEFSNTPAFTRRIRVGVSSTHYYAMKPRDEQRLVALSRSSEPPGRIYWRVRSNALGSVTSTRVLRFRDP